MQPTNEPPQQPSYPPPPSEPAAQPYAPAPSGAEPPAHAAGWPPPGSGSWSAPAYEPPPPSAAVKTGRPWLVALMAFVTFLVLIAAIGNQWATKAIVKHTTTGGFWDNAARAAFTYQWRFSPQGGHDFARLWVGSLVLVGTALVLTLLLVAVIARGKGGFGQAFIGTWMSVVVATMLAGYVRALVVNAKQLGIQSTGKPNVVFFSPLSPSASALAAGFGVGLIVALVAGLAAVLSRRTEVITAPVPTSFFDTPVDGGEAELPSREPWTAPPAPVPGPVASPSPWTDAADEPASAEADDSGPVEQPPSDAPQHTAVLPPVGNPEQSDDPDSETTRSPSSEWRRALADDRSSELPRPGDASGSDDDDDGPRHLSE